MTLKKRLLALCMAVVMVFSLCSISAFAAAPTDDKQPVVIGRYDAPLSECLEPGMAMQVGIANVRVNSYATYDSISFGRTKYFMYAARRRQRSIRGKFQFGKLRIRQQFQLFDNTLRQFP